jgi:hypothetical protein
VKSEFRSHESAARLRAYPQFLILGVVLALGASSLVCLKSPRVPTWDTQVNLPLQDNTYRLLDLLDRKYFSVGADSVIQFYAEAKIDTTRPISRIQLSPKPIASSFGLGDLLLTGDYTGRFALALEDILNTPLPEQPMLLPIPAFDFAVLREVSINGIHSAELQQGVARVTVRNFSNVGLDSARVGSDLATVGFSNIRPQSGQSERQALDGGVLGTRNDVVFSGGSAGSNGIPVLVCRYDSLVVEYQLDSLRLLAAEVRLPAAHAGRKLFLGVTASNSFALESLALVQGYAELGFANNFAFPVTIDYTVAKLNARGRVDLAPFGSQSVALDLAGRALANSGLTNSLLDVYTEVSTAASGEYVQVDKRQGLGINAAIKGMRPSYLAGELGLPLYITSPKESLPRLLPNGLSALRLPHCRMDVRIASEVGFRARVNLHIVGTNAAGDSVRLEREFQVPPGAPGDPRVSEFHVPLASVLNIGPDKVSVSYDIGIWGRGKIDERGYACGIASVSTPLRLALAHDTIELGSRVVEIGQSLREQIARYMVAGEVSAEIDNHFPLGMNACVVLTREPEPSDSGSEVRGPETDSSQLATDAVSIPVGVPAGVVDASQVCRGSTDTVVTGTLDEPGLGVFRNPRIRARLLLYVPDSDTVEIRQQDYLRIRSRAALKLKLGG